MLYNYIAIGVIVFFLGLIAYILFRKVPRLRTMDVETIAEEK